MVPTSIVDCKHCGDPIFDVPSSQLYHKECAKLARVQSANAWHKMTYPDPVSCLHCKKPITDASSRRQKLHKVCISAHNKAQHIKKTSKGEKKLILCKHCQKPIDNETRKKYHAECYRKKLNKHISEKRRKLRPEFIDCVHCKKPILHPVVKQKYHLECKQIVKKQMRKIRYQRKLLQSKKSKKVRGSQDV